ncbi:anthrone oxygenase family protein [Pseudonocardia sp. MH-G8]|uniref:anthrone oxygenase family protein n=1 Tax=Pseudonocardia sp. MH-G8 TaxID=1854588 RepID=UPI00350F9AF6
MNPWFFATFLGAPALALVAVVSNRRTRSVLLWAVVGFLFAAATFWITIVVHTPLNDALDAAGAAEAIPDLSAVRSAHEATWVPWNVARMLTSTASLAALGCALLTARPQHHERRGA